MWSLKTQNWPLITIGILTYNRKEELEKTLRIILESNYPFKEVIVVDNGSADGTGEFIQNKFPVVKVVRLEENIGVAARNIFLFSGRGKYIFQYDDDSQPYDKNTIWKIVRFLERRRDIDVLCTNVINSYTAVSETEDWRIFAWGGNSQDGYLGHFVHGSGLVIRQSVLEGISGYPKNFFWGFEEADITLQFLSKKARIVYKPDLITLHRKKSRYFESGQETFYYVRNGIWLFWKYFPTFIAFPLILMWIFKKGLRKPNHIREWAKGVRDGLKGIPELERNITFGFIAKRGLIKWALHTLFPLPLLKIFKNSKLKTQN